MGPVLEGDLVGDSNHGGYVIHHVLGFWGFGVGFSSLAVVKLLA